ncbi:hypothetical protein MLD38_036869 [Melastoma candidum]|uniref:Uncharacterized protein n=1 Tax=Melastoma candidum TaxID=119954 RepID=A0ACB9LKI4_9MYRT|nr:hypothetical protein MLD38_036869 [Melastoma candidum]
MSTVADLVASSRQFQVGCIVRRYIGCQTQVVEDDQEIGAYMFHGTVPAAHLTADDVRWMAGARRDRIIICTGDFNFLENGKFEIGEEEIEEEEKEEIQPLRPRSEWEDSDPEENRNRKGFWDNEEAELSQFVCQLYDYLFQEGGGVWTSPGSAHLHPIKG